MTDARDNRAAWELRARTWGSAPTGVLFKGLSDAANASLHAWHEGVLLQRVLPVLPGHARVLDLGCGYGRIAAIAARQRPDLEIVGQDLVRDYALAFQRIGPAVQAGIEALPFRDGAFDALLAVTSLMYVQQPDRVGAFAEIARVVRDGGLVWAVDPGLELQRLIAWARRSGAASETGGMGFSAMDYAGLARASGFELIAIGGNPALSARLLLPWIRNPRRDWHRKALGSAVVSDVTSGRASRFALHRWMLLRRIGGRSGC